MKSKIMKLAGICLMLVMLVAALGVFAITASAADDITVTIDTGASVTLKDADGDHYYDIGNADELYAYAVIMNSKNYISAELTANIIVNEALIDNLIIAEDGSATPVEGANIRPWTPINSTTNDIDVDFEGNGYEISGLYCNSEAEGVGLFGVFQSPDHFIQNLGVVDSYFCGESSVGAIIGETINRTYVHNCYSNAIVKGTDYVGGLVGSLDNGANVSQSYFKGDVYGSRYVGGLTGYIYSMGTIGGVNDSYFVGNVYGKDIVGGIAGYASQSGALLSACYVYGTVSFESGKYGGAICGTVYNTDRVGYCYYNTDLFEGPAVAYSQSSNIKTSYGVDSETFASGKVAYDMQSTLNGYFVLGQEIGTDKYPVFVNDTNTVYKNQIGGCTRKSYVYEYSNTEKEAVTTHDIVTDPPKAPTCLETGLTGGSHCTNCDKATYAQEEIPMLKHASDGGASCVNGCGEELFKVVGDKAYFLGGEFTENTFEANKNGNYSGDTWCFEAGEGFILFDGNNYTELHGATLTNDLIYSLYKADLHIFGKCRIDGLLQLNNPGGGTLTITLHDGSTLNIFAKENCPALFAADYLVIDGEGVVNMYGADFTDVKMPVLQILIDTVDAVAVGDDATLNVYPGNCAEGKAQIAVAALSLEGFTGNINAITIVGIESEEKVIYNITVLGDAVLSGDLKLSQFYFDPDTQELLDLRFTIPEGASLIVPEGVTLDLSGYDLITIEGELIVDKGAEVICEHTGGTASCTEPKKCEKCTLGYGEALGHDIVTDEGYAPTCTEKGLTEGQHCTRCDDATVEQTEIPALGHEWHAHYVEPTCAEGGGIVDFCTECGYEIRNPGDQVPALGHSYVGGVCERCGDIENVTDTETGSETAAVTESETDDKTGSETAVADDENMGCGSSIGLGAVAIVTVFGAAIVFKKKK